MKLKLYKDYLKEEIDNIKYDKKHPEKLKDYDPSNYLIIILIIAICFFLPSKIECFFNVFSSHSFSSDLNNFFPNTWECNQCKYDNYEGINRCGVCGNKRFK